jgi:hypothetical protein
VVQALTSNINQISFHDPEGHVFELNGRLFRKISRVAANRLLGFLKTRLAYNLVKENWIPTTRRLSKKELVDIGVIEDIDYVWFEHEKISFVSYAHEWVPEMLLAAAEFTLALARRLSAEGWDLKDASSNNVLFDGNRPVFVDLCSIVERKNEPYWLPKGQFERHFILPLMAYIYRAQPPNQIHISNIDGLDPATLSTLLGLKKWTSKLGIKHCALPALLSKRKPSNRRKYLNMDDSIANIAIQNWHFKSLASSLADVKRKLPKPTSRWHTYTLEREHYEAESLDNKVEIVERWTKAASPNTVLDLGANTGEFSALAAKIAVRVLAFEKDIDAARLAYKNTIDKFPNCQVVLQDLGNPSPALGWRYKEKKSITQRLDSEVDCVFALALLHHCLVSAGLPLEEVLFQLSQWTKRFLIIEYIPPDDVMFASMCEQRDIDFSWLTLDTFRQRLTLYFSLIEEIKIKRSQRVLFYCTKHK